MRPLAPSSRGLWRACLWGVAAPALCTLIDWPFRHTLAPASILMTYLLAVFLVATRIGHGASIIASLLSAPAFAFFFAPPIFSLAIKDLENIIGLVVMLVVAHVTSRLLERLRMQADIAAQRERRAVALYRLSQALAVAQNEAEIVRTAVRHIRNEFGVAATLLLRDDSGRLADPVADSLPEAPQGIDLAFARAVLDRGQSEAGTDSGTYLPLVGSEGPCGVLALPSVKAPQRLDGEARTFLETFCSQIAQALDRVRLAAQAREASIQVEAEALRNALLSAISHDLRTPLTRIVGTASTLAEQDTELTSSERREFTEIIQVEAQHMADLMSKILDMARLATGKLVLHREWNALEEIVGGALARLDKVLQDRPVQIRLPDDLPLVWVDAVLLQQVLINLIENAVKYTEAGSLIAITAEKQSSRLSLAVADRGPGFPPGAEAKLFEKFYRLEAESPHTGVGLGLALCRAVVEAHGGTLSAANRPQGGACFTLTLPLHAAPPVWEEPVEAES